MLPEVLEKNHLRVDFLDEVVSSHHLTDTWVESTLIDRGRLALI